MTASDRGNTRVASRFDPMSRHFLRALKTIVDAADKAGKPVTLCGEIAGRPLSALALVGIGFRSLSMSAASIGPVKAALLTLDVGKLRARLEPLLASSDGEDGIRAMLADFAEAEGVAL
jgi:phosphotransferase system enzyme I (PtsP)